MKNNDTTKQFLFRNRPAHIKTQHEWRKLVHSIMIPPDPRFSWEKNEHTGEWTRYRI